MSRRKASDRKRWNPFGSIQNKLLAFSIAGILPTIVVALTGYYAIARLNQKADIMFVATSALRNHWEVDMLRDALRSDVLGMLVAETDSERTGKQAAFRLHAARLRNAIARNRAQAMDPAGRAALDTLSPFLEAYVGEAESIQALAGHEHAGALQRVPHFEETSQELDLRQAEVSDLLMRQESESERASARVLESNKRLLLYISLLWLIGFSSVSWWMSRRLSRPLGAGMQTILAKSNIVAMFVGDGCGRIRDANDAYLRLLGPSREQLEAGQVRWHGTVGPESLALVRGFQEQLDEQGVTTPTELELIHADGHRIPVLLGMATLDRAEDTVIGMVVDVTARKRSEEQLRRSEQRLRALVDSLDDIVVEMDEQGTFLDVWTRSDDLLPRPKAQMIGQNVRTILGERVAEVYLSKVRAALDTGGCQAWEHTYQLNGDDARWFLVRFHPIRSGNGRSCTVCLVVSEITERKRGEAELRKAKEAAEAASVAKSEFLANMSHEIRTPLNGILGTLDLMLDSRLEGEQREFATLAKTSAESLLTILSDILDLSKVEARKLDLRLERFCLKEALKGAVDAQMILAQKKGLRLSFEVDDTVPEELIGDEMRLRQVVLNLIGNGIKFTAAGEVALSVTVETCSKEGVQLHFVVRDTGIGIPVDKQKRIFEAFTQADGSMTRRYGGTGLGLTISARLVEMMEGRMWVESAPGAGSRFHFTASFKTASKTVIPMVRSERAAGAARRPENRKNLRILLAEDNMVNQRVAVHMLKKQGHNVVVARNGREALAAIEQGPFDIVLMDVQMPEMTGLEAAQAIRSREKIRGGHVPIIALTADAMQGDREICLKSGMDDYLAKPFRPDALMSMLHTHAAPALRKQAIS